MATHPCKFGLDPRKFRKKHFACQSANSSERTVTGAEAISILIEVEVISEADLTTTAIETIVLLTTIATGVEIMMVHHLIDPMHALIVVA